MKPIRECYCVDDHTMIQLLQTQEYPAYNGTKQIKFALLKCLQCGGLRGEPAQNMRVYLFTNPAEVTASFQEFCNHIQSSITEMGLPRAATTWEKVSHFLRGLFKNV